MKAAKVAVSLPKETFEQVERLRQELGLARSVAVLEALVLWLHKKKEEKLEARYTKGYQRKPEQAAEVEPFFRAGLSSFNREKW